jgi:UDP-N-acetylmuramyl pentapeptide phosphotransferase/UDP-N-acetylglucosamine-1-phosphate transferase
MALMFWSMFGVQDSWFMVQDWYWKVAIIIAALIVCVGATNIINFMDGINGITAGYSLAVLVPLLLANRAGGFIEESFLVVAIIGVLVFSIINFRPKGKAKCFAGAECHRAGFSSAHPSAHEIVRDGCMFEGTLA